MLWYSVYSPDLLIGAQDARARVYWSHSVNVTLDGGCFLLLPYPLCLFVLGSLQGLRRDWARAPVAWIGKEVGGEERRVMLEQVKELWEAKVSK